MSRLARKCFWSLLVLFALVGQVRAADESFAYQLLGNPLLILVVFLAIDMIAFAYHKIRK